MSMAYERHHDWSPLGLSSDPVPGDPWVVRSAGLDYIDIADAIKDAARKLRRLDEIGDTSLATDELRDKAKGVADNISKAHDRYRATGVALRDYAPKLEDAQSESYAALLDAKKAQGDAEDAATSKAHYLKLADEADDPDDVLKYTDLANDGSAAGAANAKLTAAKNRLHDATDARDKAADAAADEIKDITDHDGLKDSWWDDWGADLLKIITEVAGWISAIAGILALLVCWIPVIGQALAGILLIVAAVAAVINAVGSLILAATGEMSWTDALIAVVGAVLACVGLGGAAKAITGAAKVAEVSEAAAATSRTATSTTKAVTEVAESAGSADDIVSAGSKVTHAADDALSADEAATAADKMNEFAAAQDAGGYDVDKMTAEGVQNMTRSQVDESLTQYAKPIEQPHVGQTIRRVHGPDGLDGGSFTPSDLSDIDHTASTMGLPADNTMDLVSEFRITDAADLDNVIVRHALPYDGNPGGLAEYYFKPPPLNPDGSRQAWDFTAKGLELIRTVPFSVPK